MTFANLGLALAGVACVAIPILIHLLFRRRRKPVVWGAMRFLIEAVRRQRKRLTLEQLLLLAARCGIVACVALAVGRPVLEAVGALGGASARTVYILIDNGLASSASDPSSNSDQPALDRHKRAAREILSSLSGADRAALISLGGPADALVSPPSSDLAALGALVDALAPTASATDLAGGLDAVAAALGADSGAPPSDSFIFVLCDFWEGSADLARPLPRHTLDAITARRVRLLASTPRSDSPGNVQVVSVEPMRSLLLTGADPGGADAAGAPSSEPESIRVALRRSGPSIGEAAASIIRLRVASLRAALGAGAEIGSAPLRWSPGQSEASVTIAAAPEALLAAAGDSGAAAIIAEIDRDSISADNSFRRPVDVRAGLRVGVAARRRFGGALRADRMAPEDWLRLALRPAEHTPVEVVPIEPAAIDAPSLAGLDALLIPRPDQLADDGWARIASFLDAGGLVIVFPSPDATVHLWADAMQAALRAPWSLERETISHDPPLNLAVEQPSTPLLGLIAGEFEALSRRVEFARTLPLRAPTDPATRTLLTLSDGSPLAVAAQSTDSSDDLRQSRGLLIYFAASPTLAWTDLPAKPLMLPLIQEFVRQGAGEARGASWARAGSRPTAPAHSVELRPVDERRAASAPRAADSEPVLLDAAARAVAPVRRAALFRAVDDRGATRGLVAVNADADGGRTNILPAQSVESWLAASGLGAAGVEFFDPSTSSAPADAQAPSARSASAFLASAQTGSAISLPLLIAALALALLETVMARFFSHASVERNSAPPRPAGEPA